MAQPEPEPPPSSEVSPGPGGLPAIETPEEERKRNRWLLIRETLAFQAKMLLEGTRDLLLVPLTLLAAALGLAVGGARPQRFLFDVMRTGRRFDRWLALFGPVEHEFDSPRADPERQTADSYLQRFEQVLIEQHERGGITTQVKQKVDDLLDGLEKTASTTQRHVAQHFETPAHPEREADAPEEKAGGAN
ncbi:MAG: hypothetical protein HRU00_11615 [Myxococcales bacterium]|nr:hypothetical protein [Myxococcales bacterium]